MLEMELDKSELLREEVCYTRLDCGLEVATLEKRGFAKKYAVLATRYGSIDTRFRIVGAADPVSTPEGIAHFLELSCSRRKTVPSTTSLPTLAPTPMPSPTTR